MWIQWSQIVVSHRPFTARMVQKRLSPAKTQPKPITPGSVKMLMLVEAGIIWFLTYWVLSEYDYNAYFRAYANDAILSHITTYSAVLGLGIGLAGSATAAILYTNLQRAKRRLETIATPRIRGAVKKAMSSLPTPDLLSTSGLGTENSGAASSSSMPVQAVPSGSTPDDSKKQSS